MCAKRKPDLLFYNFVDLTQFGEVRPFREDGRQGIEVEWTELRNVKMVFVRFKNATDEVPADKHYVQYWNRSWPSQRRGGWQRLEDPWNGDWITAQAKVEQQDGYIFYEMKPLTTDEVPHAYDIRHGHRRTLKTRFVMEGDNLPEIEMFGVYSGSQWHEAELLFDLGCLAEGKENWDARVEVTNGELLGLEPVDDGVKVKGDDGWKCRVDGRPQAVRVKVRYAKADDRLSYDRGAVIIRTTERQGFSVFVDDVINEGSIFIRDLGVLVSAEDRRFAMWDEPAAALWDSTILERTAEMPEQNMQNALEHWPRKRSKDFPIGVPGGRQEFFSEPCGGLSMYRKSLRTEGPDTERRAWRHFKVYYTYGTEQNPELNHEKRPTVKRWLEDDELPLVHAEWTEGDLVYHTRAVATVLHGNLEDESKRTGAEPLVCLQQMTIQNLGQEARESVLYLGMTAQPGYAMDDRGVFQVKGSEVARQQAEKIEAMEGAEYVDLNEDAAKDVEQPAGDLTLGQLVVDEGRPEIVEMDAGVTEQAVRYTFTLQPGETKTIELKVPYLHLLEDADVDRLCQLRYEDEVDKVLAFWKQELDKGMQINVPDRLLTDFYRANLWHVLISADKDPQTGLYNAHAGTVVYDMFANETCMISRSLEMRGWHDVARAYLEPFFAYQGDKALPGNFQSQEGVFYSAGDYTHLPYNMHHGFVLWAAAEDYWWTEDAAWFESKIPALIKGCDWIINERQATLVEKNGQRPPEYGLAPAGQLEDVGEYQYWYATNAYYYLGLNSVAAVLEELGHSEAPRLRKEAEAYKQDILASATEMVTRTPVVRLLDGTYIPYLPARVYARTHLAEGWIREGLYGPLHLVDVGILPPDHQITDWILLDLEDNIFVRPESGYEFDSLEDRWFNWGGFNLQPTLVFNGIAHLRRAEVNNFLRTFYNVFVGSIYQEGRHFTEWIPEPGNGGGPLFKPPDECKFVQWLRMMLIREEDNELFLGSGMPRTWTADGKKVSITRAQSYFGEIDFEVESKIHDFAIEAHYTVRPRKRQPERIYVRIPHLAGTQPVRIYVNERVCTCWDKEREWLVLPGELQQAQLRLEYPPCRNRQLKRSKQ